MKSSLPAIVSPLHRLKHISCRWSLQPAVKETALQQPQRLSNRHILRHVNQQQHGHLSFRGKLREPLLVKQEAIVSAGLWRSRRCFMGNISSSRTPRLLFSLRADTIRVWAEEERRRLQHKYSRKNKCWRYFGLCVCLCVFLWRLFSWRFSRRLLVSSGHQTFSAEPPQHV